MVKDFIDTNDFSAKELLDMIQLSLSIKDAIRGGYNLVSPYLSGR